MAEVICSPSIDDACRRKLPVGNFADGGDLHEPAQSSETAAEADSACRSIGTEQNPEPVDVERLIADRDAALADVASFKARLSKMRGELEQQKEKACHDGYQAGFDQACRKVAEEQAESCEALKALLGSLSDEQVKLIRMAEDAAVEIGFAAAAKILGRMSIERGLVQAAVKEAISKVSEREGLIVYLAPSDFLTMEALKAQSANGHFWSRIEFKEDDQVGIGGCILRSRLGCLDARLDYQIDELKKLLIAARARKAEENPN
jgi:flagellar biosynthesis/type III secretory pathway protein FliH